MKSPAIYPLVLLLTVSGARWGPPGDGVPETREEKLRAVLRAQDARQASDSVFVRLLSDPDAVVRTRATIACGSLQDTALIPALLANLTGGPPPVQEAAAFAIGQTAPMLGGTGAADLGAEIIRLHLDRTVAAGRMVEELGKFASARELDALTKRARSRRAEPADQYLMGVARFAIRGITSADAAGFAVECLSGFPSSGWKAAYALQRMGDIPATRSAARGLSAALSDADPLVRMNIAALFGKIGGDSTLVDPLARLAESDPDWRVRVNALKALGNHPLAARTEGALAKALNDEDESIVLTALTVIAGYGGENRHDAALKGSLLGTVRSLALGEGRPDRWQCRSSAAYALARIEGGKALPDLAPPPAAQPLLTAGLITALGATGDPAAFVRLAPYLSDPDPLFSRTALEASLAIAVANPADSAILEGVWAASVSALGSGDMAVITTAAANLGDSLLLRKESAPALARSLETLRSPADIEAIQEVCRTMARLRDTSVAGSLRRMAAAGDPPAALAASAALKALTGEEIPIPRPTPRSSAPEAVFPFLESLPETIAVTLKTGNGDILMEWYRDAAPFTISSLLKLAGERAFFDGLTFHRVVPNFVIQGGDPRGDGWGGPGYSLRSEFSPLSYGTGVVGIASAGKDTEGSQFFVTHSPQPHLDGRYTIIGRVVGGMDVVDGIQVGDRIVRLTRSDR